MAFNAKRKVYESLPLPLKKGLCILPFSWVAGKSYRRVCERAHWFDTASPSDLRHYQERQLAEVLRYAVAQIPAYQHLKRIVEKANPFDALREFPLLTKDAVQANPESYLAKDFKTIPHYRTTTGGTSGNQLTIFLDDASQSMEMAFMHRQWERVGYTPAQRKATFRGVSFPSLARGTYWQENPIYNEVQFSPFHMTEANLALYCEEFVRYKPAFLHGYPSALNLLAEYVIRHRLEPKMPTIKAALLASEGALTEQRERIALAFNTRVFSWYGHSERVVLAGECERNDTYHHFPDYGILEIIDEDGNRCERDGARGEIVGTGLLNRCMPLIRYRTEDYAIRLPSTCECGRNWDRFMAVEGRWKQEMVFGRGGARVSIAALNMHGPLFENVVRYQYCQEVEGACLIKVMVNPAFGEHDRQGIERAYNSKVGEAVEFRVQVVREIPLTARGKLKLLDSRLNSPGPQT